ncbi:MAG: DUF488 domain-containing protein [Clostridiales bacterium]|jgi:uncharacterized protein (DUF488 family)|nr:DUF488 domain-containing protein [Clostridiales bacterium]
MTDKLFSIGYAGLSVQDYTDLLRQNNVQAVVDIRSVPYSERFPDYNKENLQALLYGYGIYYRNYAKEFGAQQRDRHYFSNEGYLDFELFCLSERFVSGFNKLKDGMEKGYTFALMCSEKDPFEYDTKQKTTNI